jgi:hypothetical protein
MTTHKQELSRFTRLSIEALYFTGALMGTTGSVLLLSRKTDEDIFIGISFIVIALVIQAASHKSLISNSSMYYYLLGKLLSVLTGFLFFVNLPLALEHRAIIAVVTLALAVGIHLENLFAQRVWHIVTILSCFCALVLLIGGVVVTSPKHLVIPGGYLVLSGIFAVWFRWTGRRKIFQDIEDKKVVLEYKSIDIKDLWYRGRLRDIFSLPEDFTGLELAESYRKSMGKNEGHEKEEQILIETRSILKVKVKYELYKKSCEIMESIKKKVGHKRFNKKEAIIWKELWAEIKENYNLRPDLVTTQVQKELCNKYVKK